uniref:helix-turn-helix domain-containing protein n=1 Tax=Shigella sp. FC1967 TaxID=1898041 RepID=UPI00257093F8
RQLKITENEMSERLGISILHYSQLEDGHLKITVDQLITISYILDVRQLKITENEMSERLGISILHYSQLEDGHLKITV